MSTMYQASPNFNTQMEEMERTTPGHYSEWNKRHRQLLDNDEYLKQNEENRGLSVVDGALCITYESED